MIGPAGLDVGITDCESTEGIPDTIANRAAIISARLHNPGTNAWATTGNVIEVLVAAAELDTEVRDLAQLANFDALPEVERGAAHDELQG